MTAPAFDDFELNPLPPRRHVVLDEINQSMPGHPVFHFMTLSCGHIENATVDLEVLKPLRIDEWHCTQCPPVPAGARRLDLMGERKAK